MIDNLVCDNHREVELVCIQLKSARHFEEPIGSFGEVRSGIVEIGTEEGGDGVDDDKLDGHGEGPREEVMGLLEECEELFDGLDGLNKDIVTGIARLAKRVTILQRFSVPEGVEMVEFSGGDEGGGELLQAARGEVTFGVDVERAGEEAVLGRRELSGEEELEAKLRFAGTGLTNDLRDATARNTAVQERIKKPATEPAFTTSAASP